MENLANFTLGRNLSKRLDTEEAPAFLFTLEPTAQVYLRVRQTAISPHTPFTLRDKFMQTVLPRSSSQYSYLKIAL
jgi:hypothetical protein